MFREILPEAQRQELIQKAKEKLQPPAPVLQEGAPAPEGEEAPAPPVPVLELTLEDLGWQTVLFDSDFKVGDSTKGLGFVTPAGPLTNTTRFQVDTASEKNTVRVPNESKKSINSFKMQHRSDQVPTMSSAHQ